MPKGRHPVDVAGQILEQVGRSKPAVHTPVDIGECVQVVQQGTVDVASMFDDK
jgi:hypothetical protein